MFARHISDAVLAAAGQNPVVTVMGPRQSGKTTLCRALFPGHEYRSLEAPDVRSQALQDPRGFLASAQRMVIDEVQRAPDLLSYIQGMVDEDRRPRALHPDRLPKPVADGISIANAGRPGCLA